MAVRSKLVLAFGVLLVLLTAVLSQLTLAHGYTYVYWRMPSNVVTYSCGNAELARAVQAWAAVSDIEDGGCSASPNIALNVINPWPFSDRGAQAVGIAQGSMRIDVAPWNAHSYTVMLHEVGHTLGLGHSMSVGWPAHGDPGPSGAVMHWNPCAHPLGTTTPYTDDEICNALNADDIAGIRSLYGPYPEQPTLTPTLTPSLTPTLTPSLATPTRTPTLKPTSVPSLIPSLAPTLAPSLTPVPPQRWRVFVAQVTSQ